MENPDTWGPVEKVIHEALKEDEKARGSFTYGFSTERRIANALRHAGLLYKGL